MRALAIRTSILLVSVAATPLSAASAGSIGFRVYGGHGSLAMGKINRAIDHQNDLFYRFDPEDAYKGLHGGQLFEVDLMCAQDSSYGVVVSYDWTEAYVENQSLGIDTYSRSFLTASGDFVSAGLWKHIGRTSPVSVSLKGGYGFGRCEWRSVEGVRPGFLQPAESVSRRRIFGGGLICELGVSGQADLLPCHSLFGIVEISYRYRALAIQSETIRAGVSSVEQYSRDFTRRVVDLDFSGLAFKIGIGQMIGFGSKP